MNKMNGLAKLILREDHNKFRTTFKNLVNNPPVENRTALKNQLVKELSQHDNTEQHLVHPTYVYLKGDDSTHKTVLKQEETFVAKLHKFDKMDANDPKFSDAVKDLWKDLQQHMEEEENNEFSVIEKELPKNYLESLNTTISTLKNVQPTRPHPNAPLKPTTGNVVVGPIASFLDRLRDLGREFPKGDLVSETEKTKSSSASSSNTQSEQQGNKQYQQKN